MKRETPNLKPKTQNHKLETGNLKRRADGPITWLALCLLLVGAPPVLGADEIRVVETRVIPVERAPGESATHELRLSLYGFFDSRWSSREIVAGVLEGAQLLEQCGVALTGAELRTLETPRRFRDYDTPVSRELLRRIKVSKPAVFFVDDTRNNPAFDAEAIGRENAVTRPELADTVWIAHDARDLAHTVAHELVHVLSNDGGHSNEPGNLMRATTSWRNTRLTDEQCARLRTRGEANGLLTLKPAQKRE